MKIYAGTSGFAYKEWKGQFYPEKIKPEEMLGFYSEHLNTVEINNTFHRMPKESVLESWAEHVRGRFIFALKARQVITHLKRLRNVYEETDYFFRTSSVLHRKLGPVLFQFPKSFRVDKSLLEEFLNLVPGNACAFEFRSPTWIDDAVLNLLHEKGCSLCQADTDDEPVKDIISVGKWGYLRLRRADYSESELNRWLERVHGQKWDKAFIFFKHEDTNGRSPLMAVRFRELAEVQYAVKG
jgi:uncharacterized protein YecE (DUF72 family)